MSGLALDCSIAVSWCFEDEAAPATDALLDRVRDEGAWVPALWHLELGNVLLQAGRRGRIEPSDIGLRLDLLMALPILTDDAGTARAREILALARAEQLTTYEAAYLELALRRGLPLATKDRPLAEAARRVGVATLP